MSLLDHAISGLTPSAPKIIIYGGTGVGKSTLASKCPVKTIMLDIEGGLPRIDCMKSPKLNTWPEIQECLVDLADTNKHGYEAVAIDTIDWVLRAIEVHITGSARNPLATLGTYGKGYGQGQSIMKNMVYDQLKAVLDQIHAHGIAIIMTAHAKRMKFEDADGKEVEQLAPELPQGYMTPILEWVHDIWYLPPTPKGAKRAIITEPTKTLNAKSRFGIPNMTLAEDWSEIAPYFDEAPQETN